MAVTAALRPGSANLAADGAGLLLKVFAGEVLSTFEETNVMMGLTRVKTVGGNAVSWQFPVLGTAGTKYHTAGENLLTDTGYLQTIRGGERKIYADKLLTSTVFIDKLDTVLNHWDARAEYSKELGRALAKTVDINLTRVAFEAAHTAAGGVFTGAKGGNLIVESAALTSGAAFVDAIFRMKVAMDEQDVPKEDRYCVMPPAQMRLLFTDGDGTLPSGLQWIDADFNGVPNGTYGNGKVPMLGGFMLIESNHLDTVAGTYGDFENQYSATANNDYVIQIESGETQAAIFFQREALGTVKIADISVESEYMIEYQGDVLVAKMALGHGVLRPECAGNVAIA